MEVVEAVNISLAIYHHQQMEAEGHPSHLTDFLQEGSDLEELWSNLTSVQQKAFEDFVRKNATLYGDFPEHYSTEEDMEERQAILEKIEDKLFDELSSIMDLN